MPPYHLRRLILDRTRRELELVSSKCLVAIQDLDRDSESTVRSAMDALDGSGVALQKALNRLLVLQDVEQDWFLSDYLIQENPSPAASTVKTRFSPFADESRQSLAV